MTRLGPALAVREFRLWWLACMAMNVALQMIDVAIGWQVYVEHRSTLDLGLIGLVEFVPLCVLALPAGHVADRMPRRTVFAASLLAATAVGAGLATLSAAGVTAVVPYLALALATGVTMAFFSPASAAMPPTLVSADLLPSAMTLGAVAARAGAVAGPAVAGALFAVTAPLAYSTAAGLCVAGCAAVFAMSAGRRAVEGAGSAPQMRTAMEGLAFVRRTPVLLGSMLLDLLGVLFGGAIALLPVFASTVLHTGPTGLGILRAAPPVGALLAAAVITRRPLRARVGRKLLSAVAVFGASMIVFALSHSYALSLLALGLSGYADLYSMNIRATISALATPDRLRGRVGAVEMVFISASNELGAFESGLAASLLGSVPTVIAGGAVTIALAVGWSRAFPSLASIDEPREIGATAAAGAHAAAAELGLPLAEAVD